MSDLFSPYMSSVSLDSSSDVSPSDDSSQSTPPPSLKSRKEEEKNKKKRCRTFYKRDDEGNYIIPHVPLPRIPKNDVRRSYGLFFTNVYNSGDGILLDRFVKHVFPGQELYRYHLGVQGQLYTLEPGSDLLYRFCYENMCISPDVTFHFDSQKIKVRSDGTSSVIGQFTIAGNTVMSCPYEEMLMAGDQLMTPSFRLDHSRKRIVSLLPTTPSTSESTRPTTSSADAGEDLASQFQAYPSSQHRFSRHRDFHQIQLLKKMKYQMLQSSGASVGASPRSAVPDPTLFLHSSSVFQRYERPKVLSFTITGEFIFAIDEHYQITDMTMSMMDYQVRPV